MTTLQSDTLHTYHCKCGKLLFKGILLDSTIQIKCKKCGELMAFQGFNGQSAPDNRFAIMFNQRGEVISASANTEKLFGYKLSNLLKMTYDQLSPTTTSESSLRTSFSQMWALPNKDRYLFKGKTVFRHKSGRLTPGIIQSKFIVTPDNTYMFSIFHAGATLENVSSEPEFWHLVEYPFFLQIGRNGVCTYANPARKPPVSRSPLEIIGKHYATFLQESAIVRRTLDEKLRQSKPFALLGKTYKRVTGTTIKMDAFFAPNLDEHGRVADFTVYVFSSELLGEYHERLARSAVL